MNNLSKRQWTPSINIKESFELMLEWCIKAREKNILKKKNPKIFFSFIVKDTPPFYHMNSTGALFKYSQKDTPYIDSLRDVILRELSVALKTHFFLFPTEKVAHEPYFFTFPSLENPNEIITGLIYKIEKSDISIIVCEQDLSKLFSKINIVCEFNTVVIEDSFKWYHMKNWYHIKNKNNTHYTDYNDILLNLKKNIQDAKEANTKDELEKLVSIIEVPYEIKDDIKPLGIEWNNKIKTWFLPKTFDIDSVNEFIQFKKMN